MEYKNLDELKKSFAGVIKVNGPRRVEISSEDKLKKELMDRLVWNAVFNSNEDMKKTCCALIRNIACAFGAVPASIQAVYNDMGAGKLSGFTVPAINIRGLTYDTSRALFRAAKKLNAFPVIFEIARSEIGYTGQRPLEYATCVLAAAVKEGHKGPVYIQGDHFQVNLKKYQKDAEAELEAIHNLIGEGIEAGFYNIDIDTSTLVDLSKPTLQEQQRLNFELCAGLTDYIRKKEPKGVTISVGGEIGEVGGKNSTVEEFEAYMEGYKQSLAKMNGGAAGISKISVQTGTSHGGIPLPDGTVAKVKLDFDVLKNISKVAKSKYKMSGTVQHGASTLPDDLFDKFPETGTSEIHLATGFQNMVYDSKYFPKDLKEDVYEYLRKECASEKKEGQTDEQFIYSTRKKGFGPFKKRMWSLPKDKLDGITRELEEKFAFLFKKLNIAEKGDLAEKYTSKADVSVDLPKGLV